MGKQVRFFMLAPDENRFLDFLSGNLNVKYVLPTSEFPDLIVGSPKAIPSLGGIKFYLWDTRNDLKPFIKTSSRKMYNEKTGQMIDTGKVVYSISALNAPVIEYYRSKIDENEVLISGRIWAEVYALSENNKFVYKGDQFQKWYEELATWLRRNLKRMKGHDQYFGADALGWQQSGKALGA